VCSLEDIGVKPNDACLKQESPYEGRPLVGRCEKRRCEKGSL